MAGGKWRGGERRKKKESLRNLEKKMGCLLEETRKTSRKNGRGKTENEKGIDVGLNIVERNTKITFSSSLTHCFANKVENKI